MLKYIVKRLLLTIPLLLGIATATFFVVHLAPGDPMAMYLEERGNREIDPQLVELIRQKYGLDQPLHVQYLRWLQCLDSATTVWEHSSEPSSR